MIDGVQLKYLLQTQAFAPVPFSKTHAEISRVVEGTFMDFLERPYEERALINAYEDRPQFRNSQLGFVQRNPNAGQGHDHKVFIHYRPEMEIHFAGAMRAHPLIGGLMEELRPLYHANTQTLRSVLEQFEDDFPGVTQSFFQRDQGEEFYLRILAYLDDKNQAQPHQDIAGATLADAESEPGLYVGHDETNVTPIVHKDRWAIFFPGYTFREETSDDYPGSWHGAQMRARAKRLTPSPKRVPMSLAERLVRWAVVFFAHGKKRRTIPREESHRPHPLAVERARMLRAGWRPNFAPLVAAGE
jgi:hypothetical protein